LKVPEGQGASSAGRDTGDEGGKGADHLGPQFLIARQKTVLVISRERKRECEREINKLQGIIRYYRKELTMK
jgi:hypothetical protein